MVETIGFIISLLALLYLFVQNKSSSQPRGRPASSQKEEAEEDPFREFLKAMENEAEAREAAQRMPPPPPPVRKKERHKKAPPLADRKLVSSIEERHLKSSLEERHIASRFNHREDVAGRTLASSLHHRNEGEGKLRASRAQSIIQRLSHRRDMIIYQEIIKKPKALRSEDFDR